MSIRSHLIELLEEASSGLPQITKRKMFGCDALFAKEAIFGLIWKTGRIGVKLPEASAFDELMAVSGSDPWKAGDRTMSHWVLVPEEFHDAPESLQQWVKRAHAFALAASGLPKRAGKKSTVKAKSAKAVKPPAKKKTETTKRAETPKKKAKRALRK